MATREQRTILALARDLIKGATISSAQTCALGLDEHDIYTVRDRAFRLNRSIRIASGYNPVDHVWYVHLSTNNQENIR